MGLRYVAGAAGGQDFDRHVAIEARVFRAIDLAHASGPDGAHNLVALKVLPAALAKDSEQRARFEREARAASSLNHPHICAIYDVGSQDSIDFLVMELLEGETVAEVAARGPMPLADVMRIGAQMADALDRAHKKGLIHRDLKPANIMLLRPASKSGSLHAKLLDFGLARPTSAKSNDETMS